MSKLLWLARLILLMTLVIFRHNQGPMKIVKYFYNTEKSLNTSDRSRPPKG